jgi:ADP-ribose pyrophosphatase
MSARDQTIQARCGCGTRASSAANKPSVFVLLHPGSGYTSAMSFERKMIYDGRVIKVSVDTVDLPNGLRIPLEIVRHPGGAAVVALDAQNRVCLLRQYRHAAGGYIYELPAGKLEVDEPPDVTIKRELAEEAGMHAADWQSLGAYFSSPGVFTEVIHLYLATGLTPVAARPEADEVFEIEWWPLEQAMERARNGELADAKTIIGILRAGSR